MKLQSVVPVFLSVSVFMLSGCLVRSYTVTRDRVDQELPGNRGYLTGTKSTTGTPRPKTRTIRVVEVELHSPIKFERAPKKAPPAPASVASPHSDSEVIGNRGYLTQSSSPEITDATLPQYDSYTVQKGDTLQKISRQLYGTTKKWYSLYELNKDVLKGPDKLYPGQVIRIPADQTKTTLPTENLK